MRFISALVVAAVAASATGLQITPQDIPARSRLGQRLLSQARALGNNNNNNYDFSWAVDYSLKYEGCATLVQYNGGNGNNKNNNNKNGYGLISSETIVKLSLCPTSGSGSCGEYVAPMANFVQQWTEALMNAKEYECEMIRQNCNCENGNDDQNCESKCYYAAGREDCIEVEEENQQDFELERYLECREMENKNKNNNNNNNGNNNGNYYYSDDMYNQYYVGPYCSSDGYSIHLGTFTDQYCSTRVSKEQAFYNRYGFELPYTSKGIIEKKSISCEQQNNKNNNNNNNNNNQQAEPSELCQQVYQSAAKCEKDLSIDYPDTTGCQFIDYILPRLSYTGRISSQESSVLRGGSRSSRMFAWIFALSTIVLGAYSFFLYRKINRSKVDLSHSADAAMT